MKTAGVLFALAVAAGWFAPGARIVKPARMGEYRVLAGDFHVHMFPLDESTLSPWDLVVEARRRGLDVIALTGHNQVWTGKAGRWFSRLTGGPLVLVGEEILHEESIGRENSIGEKNPAVYHMIAVGIEHNVDWRGTAADSIAAIHAQGGVAIAAHPLKEFWPAYDAAAMAGLDGAEVLHPSAFVSAGYAAQLREFYARQPLTAIGSSDFHGIGHPGFSRTYLFVHEVTDQEVLDALRQRKTVAVDRDGRTYGDPELIRLAEANGGLPPSGVAPETGWMTGLSRAAALAAMLVAVLFGFKTAERQGNQKPPKLV